MIQLIQRHRERDEKQQQIAEQSQSEKQQQQISKTMNIGGAKVCKLEANNNKKKIK